MARVLDVSYNLELYHNGKIVIHETCTLEDGSKRSNQCYYDNDVSEYIGKRVSKALSQWILLKESNYGYYGKR